MGLFVLAVGLVLGVPLVPLAAVWAMLTDLIPQIGGALGGVVFVALALTESVPTAIIAGVLFVTYMTIENHVIQPAVIGRSVDLTAPTTMVAALIGGAVAGIPGALVATPLVGASQAPVPRGPRPPPAADCSGVIDSAGRVRLAARSCRVESSSLPPCDGRWRIPSDGDDTALDDTTTVAVAPGERVQLRRTAPSRCSSLDSPSS